MGVLTNGRCQRCDRPASTVTDGISVSPRPRRGPREKTRGL